MKTFIATVALALASSTTLTAFADSGPDQPAWHEQEVLVLDIASMT